MTEPRPEQRCGGLLREGEYAVKGDVCLRPADHDGPCSPNPDPEPVERGEEWTICANCGNVLLPEGPGFTHAPYRSCGDPRPVKVVPFRSLTEAQDRARRAEEERDEAIKEREEVWAINQALASDAELLEAKRRAESLETALHEAREALTEIAEGDTGGTYHPDVHERGAVGNCRDYVALIRSIARSALPLYQSR